MLSLRYVVKGTGLETSILVGTAGWSIPVPCAAEFPGNGTHLERYASQMGCAEINSSFYRPHRESTYAKWAAMVPAGFRFSVKVPKIVTHGASLVPPPALLEQFIAQVAGLGEKLGALLVQLPPRRVFSADGAQELFEQLRSLHPVGAVVVEPRHASWFCAEADSLLRQLGVARVASDPAIVAAAAEPGGDPAVLYCRLHGSPRMYYSSYAETFLHNLATRLLEAKTRTFVIFDNTAAGAALKNALELQAMLADLK